MASTTKESTKAAHLSPSRDASNASNKWKIFSRLESPVRLQDLREAYEELVQGIHISQQEQVVQRQDIDIPLTYNDDERKKISITAGEKISHLSSTKPKLFNDSNSDSAASSFANLFLTCQLLLHIHGYFAKQEKLVLLSDKQFETIRTTRECCRRLWKQQQQEEEEEEEKVTKPNNDRDDNICGISLEDRVPPVYIVGSVEKISDTVTPVVAAYAWRFLNDDKSAGNDIDKKLPEKNEYDDDDVDHSTTTAHSGQENVLLPSAEELAMEAQILCAMAMTPTPQERKNGDSANQILVPVVPSSNPPSRRKKRKRRNQH